MNFINKFNVQQWVQSSFQLTLRYEWDILKSNFILAKYGELLAEYIKENWYRFQDDCYTALRNSQICLEELLLTLSSINPSIQFTIEYSKDQIPILDTLIKRNENGIRIDLYHKPIDTKTPIDTYGHHCKRNIPFCLARKICSIAENNTEKLKNLENLKSILLKYHYTDSIIKLRFQKVLSKPQKDLQKPIKPSNQNILPVITTFNPKLH